MSLLAHIRVLPKILAIIALLAAVTLTIGLLTTRDMASIGTRYGAFLANDAAAAANFARLNRTTVDIAYTAYRMVAEHAPAEVAKQAADIDKRVDEARSFLATIRRQVPRHAERIDAIDRLFVGLRPAFEPVIAAASAGDDAKALQALHAQVDPRLRDVLATSRPLRDVINGEVAAGTASLAEETSHSVTTAWIIIAAAIIGSLVLAVMVVQFGVVRPLRDMLAVLRKLADGDYDVDIRAVARRDEIGDVARTALVFQNNGREKVRLLKDQEDAKCRQAIERQELMLKLADDFERAVAGVVGAVSSAATELEASAQQLSAAAEQTNRQSTAVASASDHASTNVQTVASASEELASSIQEISRQVTASTEIAASAVAEATQTSDKVRTLATAADQIGSIVALIDEIAGRTNLLALNATIEAARAGASGRGFAVVASEVKSLAEQTGRATAEIGKQIAAIQTLTRDSSTAIEHITHTITEMNRISTGIAAAVEQQGAATQDIARNVQRASAGTAEVNANISGVQRAASSSSTASIEVLSAARALSEQSEALTAVVKNFLITIRTGPLDRRGADDPTYAGPERRADRLGGLQRAA